MPKKAKLLFWAVAGKGNPMSRRIQTHRPNSSFNHFSSIEKQIFNKKQQQINGFTVLSVSQCSASFYEIKSKFIVKRVPQLILAGLVPT